MKKLYRSDTNKVFAGIIGGIGEYAEFDPAIIRLLWVVLVVFSGIFPGIIVYLLALLVVPRREYVANHAQQEHSCKGKCGDNCNGNGGCGKEECTCKKDQQQ